MSVEESTEATAPDEAAVVDGMDWEPIKTRLLGADLDVALEAAKELRERIEIVHSTEFPRMLSSMLPAFSSVLSHCTRPNAETASTEHNVRNAVLEVLSRLPNNEVLRPHAPQILGIAMDVLTRDYEDNALLASRIIFDLHKNYRQMPQDQVQPYLDFVLGAYRSLPGSIQKNFVLPTDQNLPSSQPFAPPDSSGEAKSTDETKEQPDGKILSTQEASATKTPSSVAQTPPSTVISPSAGIPTTPPVRLAPRSSASFRVLTECPLTVMLLFQLHPRFLKTNIPPMINLMIEALALRAPPLQSLSSTEKVDSTLKRFYFSRSRELVAAQVKTLSFLTQFLKGFAEQMKPYEDRIASNVVSLMTSCPHESVGTRRELLHATRHILATDFRKGFFRHIDSLLDERVLLGSHPKHSDQVLLRPLGYSALADLIHHARSLLSTTQLSRVVYIFSRVIHDSSLKLPLAIQTTAVRLLLNLVDTIFHNKDPNPQTGRDLLARILDLLIRKLDSLNYCIPEVEEAERARKMEKSDLEVAVSVATLASSSDSADAQRTAGDERSNRIKQKLWSLDGGSQTTDTLHDAQTMVRSIVVGLKTVIWCINNYRHQREKEKGREQVKLAPGSNEEIASALQRLTNWERDLIDKYITYALPCFKVFKPIPAGDDKQVSQQTRSESILVASQYRDVLTYFAAAFTVLDSFNLRCTLGKRIDLLVDSIVDDHHVMVIPRHLLGSNQKVSFGFTSILVPFLVERMDELSLSDCNDHVFLEPRVDVDCTDESVPKELVDKAFENVKDLTADRKKRAATILELFERVLKSLALFPDNEAALRPYLRTIVATCLRSTMESPEGWPDNYSTLLRYTFRAISAGKFEESYKEILPLLPTILNGLNRVLHATDDIGMRHVIIELCLTVPARLSSLLPHMSLLLRMIVDALKSNAGDLVNLGLRTLEFWVDNLNPEFLYPILSKQTEILMELMTALSSHLRPAPYPYGLLTLRLLGKLGGRNRLFLREPLDVALNTPLKAQLPILSVPCNWSQNKQSLDSGEFAPDSAATSDADDGHSISLPLERAVEVLRLVAHCSENSKGPEKERSSEEEEGSLVKLKWSDFEKLRSLAPERVDLSGYCVDVMEETKRDQASSAFEVIRSALALVLDVQEINIADMEIDWDLEQSTKEASEGSSGEDMSADTMASVQKAWSAKNMETEELKTICMGLMYASSIKSIEEEASSLLKGFASHVFLLIVNLRRYILRIDAFGSRMSSSSAEDRTAPEEKAEPEQQLEDQDDPSQVAKSTSSPLGCFLLTGPFVGKADPFVLNRAIAEVLSNASPSTRSVGLEVIANLLQISQTLSECSAINVELKEENAYSRDSVCGTDLLFESLINSLCQASLSSPWTSQEGLHDGIFLIMENLGPEWSRRFEIEVMHVAILGLKSAPREIPIAGIKAFQFFSQVCKRLYGSPEISQGMANDLIQDPLLVSGSPDQEPQKETSTSRGSLPSDAVLRMFVSELASVKQIVRFAMRYALKLYIIDAIPSNEAEKLLTEHMPLIKRLVFARALRLLPLPEQVGVFDALAFLIHQFPSLIPLSDQHLLAFLSEFLKMSSIADGEMSDSNLNGYVVDKNGFTVLAQDKESAALLSRPPSHNTSIFLRRDCVVRSASKRSYVYIPGELTYGVQLRVSGLRLFRAVITQHADSFFDADPATPIGNIRPHVISLLFRSLISSPPMAVVAAHLALRDVLALSKSSPKEATEGKPQSRLPKELLQTCIRPVLLNLRDYTRLTVPLLRGLARLLSLLSSWFNTTLGEKLLEHLLKWTDPERIISRNLWKEGEEPLVAAAILDLFPLLPQASQFVERLVKTTIKLEIALPAYKLRQVGSPYRQPLARYLNKHCQYAVAFFFQRLRTPVYSELFQDIIKLKDSQPLRSYLSSRQCSATLLNVCFERPLGIIRSDQATSSKHAAASTQAVSSASLSEILIMHGVRIGPIAAKSEPGDVFHQDMEVKQKAVQAAQKDVARAKEHLQVRSASNSVGGDSQAALEEARRQHKEAQVTLEKALKDLQESKQKYAAEIAQPSSKKESSTDEEGDNSIAPRPMSLEALELQYQGFKLVETLVINDKEYLLEHTDVVKAFRWLWRSKGRYLRLQHEEFMPPRFRDESTMLAAFLINTAKAYPNDVDILYELLRILLQPSTSDFSSVKRFLVQTVTDELNLEQKRSLMKRFFSLLAGEGKDETKALSIQLLGIPILRAIQSATPKGTDSSQADNPDPGKDGDDSVLSQEMLTKFSTEVLFKDGSPAVCEDHLKIELLRLSILLLECAPDQLVPHRKDMIKFSWNLLKNDDSNCKNWAAVSLCRFISVFETPAKNILQVYVALLRSYQQEGKDLVRLALGILVPVLPERLPADDFQKMINYTIKIMYEEGNSAPQLAHVWHTIVAHVSIFFEHRPRFIRHMINSLNRLGLPPNCPIENRSLAVTIIGLVLEWDAQQQDTEMTVEPADEDVQSEVTVKRKEASNEYGDASADENKKHKMRKGVDGEGEDASGRIMRKDSRLLDEDMVDSIANFLVRLRILLSDSKGEGTSKVLEDRTTSLLKAVVSRWNECSIRSIYFDKVVSMCVNETEADKRALSGIDKRAKEKGKKASGKGASKVGKNTSSKAGSSPTAGSKVGEDSRMVSTSLLSACLDIFQTLVQVPENTFLKENSEKVKAVLGPCFTRIRQGDEEQIRPKLKDFLLPVLANEKQQTLDGDIMLHVNFLLESLIVESIGCDPGQNSSASDGQKGPQSREKRSGGSCLAHFSVEIIEEASKSSPDLAETFSSSLLSLAEKLCEQHVKDATSNQRQGSLYPKHGTKTNFHHKHPTPVAGILESACSAKSIQDVVDNTTKVPTVVETDWSRQIPEMGSALLSLTASIRMVGSSSIPLSFTQKRTSLFRLLSSILDSSDNIQLIMTAVGIVGKWLLVGSSRGPLTLKERKDFLWKLASYDFNGLCDVALQPVADLVACTVMECHKQYAIDKITEGGIVISNEHDEVLSGRALVACSMNANPQIRSQILQLYCCSVIGDRVFRGFQDRSPLDILWQLFHSDFEGVSGRLWTVMVVEVLLAGCRPVRKKKRLSADGETEGRTILPDSWLPSLRQKAKVKGSAPDAPDVTFGFPLTLTRERAYEGLEDCLTSISKLAHADYFVCQSLLESLLPAAWSRIPSDESRLVLLPGVESLLSRPYHVQFIRTPWVSSAESVLAYNGQKSHRTNAIRSFLRAFVKLRPLPVLDTNLLVTLAENYNAWHEILTLLEHQYEVLSENLLGVKVEKIKNVILSAIRHCFKRLGEDRIWLSLAVRSCNMPETQHAVSLDMHDMVKGAIESYSGLVDLVETTETTLTLYPNEFEMNLWEERWITLQREMCQLSVVSDYASSSGDPRLLLESAWKSQDWDKVRALCSSSSLLSAIENGDPTVKMGEILLAINEGKLSEVESLHVQTAQLCLQKWQLLPNMSTGSGVHSSLMHFFHRLVELRESGQIMAETSNHSKRRTLPDFKNLLSAWRHRLPNDFESLSDWDDVFLWRSHMFSAITSNFHWSEPGTLATLHDKPWTAIRMAKTARKQKMREVAMLSLNTITDGTMDVEDAFAKLREQILASDNPDSDAERTGGLNLINTTNLSFFHASQKSEVFRLKAYFLESLGGRSKANRAFCHSVQICPSFAKSWASWGGLCSSLGKLAERQHEIESSKSGKSESNEEANASSAKKVAQYLAQAMGCYFEAIQCDTNERYRVHLPKCLLMLTKDGSSPGILCQTLETRGAALPSWVWLPWIPQLLTSLYRIEGRAVRAVLSRLVKAYPQALYYPLRAFYLERRDVERSRGTPPASGHHEGSVAYAEELMSTLRRSHAALWSSLETVLEELIVKFKPSFDEELLVYIAGLLERAESHTDRKSLKKSETDDEDVMLSSIAKNLSRISAKFFRPTAPESSTGKLDERSKKTAEFKRKYKEMFESDFQLAPVEATENPSTPGEKLGFSDFLSRLKKWKSLLEDEVSSTPPSLPLIGASPSLALFAGETPDLWAGSCDPRHMDVPALARDRNGDPEITGNQTSASSSFVAATTAASVAAQAVAKTALSEGNGGDFGGGTATIEIPGQYVPNRISSQDSRPCPELHAKLMRFESTVRVIRRNEQLVRRIGLVGSDGKIHHFSLQWALPYWTRTDERTNQLVYFMDSILRRGILSSRNHLSMQPSAVIPIAQRLRITAEEESRVSLEDVFRLWCDQHGTSLDSASKCYHQEFLAQLESVKENELDDDAKVQAEQEARLRAFMKVSETCVDANMLLKYMHEKLDGPENLFQFRKNFCGQLAADSLMQYSFCVVERNPSRTVFLERNGQVLTPDYRFEYNNHGFLDPRKVPFRMTSNIHSLIGTLLLEGRFIPSMGTIAAAFKDAQDELDPALRLLLRDDIVAWYTSKSMAKSDGKMQDLEKQLSDRVIRNVMYVQGRIAECAPQIGEADKLPREPVDKKVRNLVKEASDPERLCTMPSSYQGWL